MPWQAHLFIGERVHDFDEARAIYLKLDPNVKFPDDVYDEWPEVPFELKLHGKSYDLGCSLFIEGEGGYPWPSEDKYNTGAMVCIPITSRYSPSILDRAHMCGRPDPFEINLEEVTDLLNQVRETWPDAQFMICDRFH